MKIVLLPGMDGTGELFESVLNELSEHECLVIPLPSSGQQDYASLVEYVKSKLPEEECILVAESFSGPIDAYLAEEEKVKVKVKGIVFVATFLTPPSKFLLAMSQLLPIKFLSKLPGSGLVLQAMMFGHQASKDLLNQFQNIIDQIDIKILKNRLKTMQSLKFIGKESNVPATYILPTNDRLVSNSKHHEFNKYFSQLQVKEVNGPHFVLQTNPEESAQIISEFVKELNCSMNNKQKHLLENHQHLDEQ